MALRQPALTAPSADPWQGGGRWATWTAVMMIASFATFVQSYVSIKLFFVGLYLVAFAICLAFRKARVVIYGGLVWFYVWIGLAGVGWALVGLVHPANHTQGVSEALRLYVIWSGAFVVLYTLLKAGPSLKVIHTAMVIAGILIPLMNFVGLYDQFSGLGLISEGVRQELDMQVGFHDGYVQITSQNLDVMFLIVPYLVSLQFRADADKSNSVLAKIALVLSVLLAVISGRRALWVVLALVPSIILLLSALTSSYCLMKHGRRRFLIACAATSVIVLGTLLISPKMVQDVGSIDRLREAFSSEDERAIQKPYLIEGFLKYPLFGSGFGAAARYIRDDQKPWAGYELTYYQMLFNLGIVGMAALGVLFSLYFARVIGLLNQFKARSAVPFALLVAYCSFFIGAYSNRYFGSFDLLFFVGLLPFLSTFQRGFDWPELRGSVTP